MKIVDANGSPGNIEIKNGMEKKTVFKLCKTVTKIFCVLFTLSKHMVVVLVLLNEKHN